MFPHLLRNREKARRGTLNKTALPTHSAVDLWMLRLLCDAELWKDLRANDMSDLDDIARQFWFSEFRFELNCSAFLSVNSKFLESGRPADINYEDLPGVRRCRRKEAGDNEDKAGEDEVVAYSDRASYLIKSAEHHLKGADSLLSVGDSSWSTVGNFWRAITRNGIVRRWLGLKEPSTLVSVKKELEGSIRDEINSLGSSCAQNFAEIQATFGLSELEVRIFAFILAVTMRSNGFAEILRCLDFSNCAMQLIVEITAKALKARQDDVSKCFESDAVLLRSGLLSLSNDSSDDIRCSFQFPDEDLYHSLLTKRVPIDKLMETTFSKVPVSELKLEDFSYLAVVQRVLLPYLRTALQKRSKGVNVLLYGLPGTGKTQLTRVLANEVGARLYEVAAKAKQSSSLRRDDSISRLQCWKMTGAFLANAESSLIAIDEAEDVFNDGGTMAFISLFGLNLNRTNKGEINKLLEENPVPTFWITNTIRAIDPSMIRRFDLVVEVPVPDIASRCKIARNAFEGKLSESAVERLGQPERLAPAVLSRTAKVASMAGFEQGLVSEADVIELVNETLRAQRFGRVPGIESVLPNYYDPNFINADVDLEKLAKGLAQAGSGRLCLYGPPGTGKTAYVHWLAKKLNRSLIRKTAAELLSCWVGETEKLIAEAFREAQRSHALLLIDEADSFLRDRTLSRASWETTQVNEMLSQIESFEGYFVATTNLLDMLDPASLRRFDLKAKFDFLNSKQALRLTKKVLDAHGLDFDEVTAQRIASLKGLTPGDFAAVNRQGRFKPIASSLDLLDRLAAEIKAKGASVAAPMGFA